MKNKKNKKTSDAYEILERRAEGDPELQRMMAIAYVNAEVAQLVYDARVAHKLTQAQLAKLVGTTQSVIARLEDADYDGHSLKMLSRIAEALGQTIEVHFVPKKKAA